MWPLILKPILIKVLHVITRFFTMLFLFTINQGLSDCLSLSFCPIRDVFSTSHNAVRLSAQSTMHYLIFRAVKSFHWNNAKSWMKSQRIWWGVSPTPQEGQCLCSTSESFQYSLSVLNLIHQLSCKEDRVFWELNLIWENHSMKMHCYVKGL